MGNDKNGDGKVTKNELPEFLQRILDRADTNKDGAIDKAEAKKMAERFGGGRRPSGAGRGPVYAKFVGPAHPLPIRVDRLRTPE
ncbi:MAG: hypothetical protein HOL01_22390 [Planctomycetaceae bacterium]|nr:hypothetical protein [Planctomycetaceae bacterium]